MVDTSNYKVGLVVAMEPCGNQKSNKPLKSCTVNVGDASNPLTIVTSAPNVREGSRVAVALVGDSVLNEEGEEMKVKKTSVGGVVSEGMLCDSRMLGWTGGAVGIAAQIPDSIELGEAPPLTKPRHENVEDKVSAAPQVEGLFEKKLTKEEKKKLAEEKRQARKAAKEAKIATT